MTKLICDGVGTSKPVADPVAIVRAAADVKAAHRRRLRPRIPVVPIVVIVVTATLIFWIANVIVSSWPPR